MTRVDHILKHVEGPRVLDVGCAGHEIRPHSRHWLHGRLQERFPEVWGIDANAEYVARLRALGFPRVSAADAEDFSLPATFRTIVAGELVEHLANPGRFLAAARRHLEPGGRLILTTPQPFALLNAAYAWMKFPKTCSNPEHACWFCPSTLAELVGRHAFSVERLELIEDYEADVASRLYRAFVAFVRVARPFLPRVLRCNAMICVLHAV